MNEDHLVVMTVDDFLDALESGPPCHLECTAAGPTCGARFDQHVMPFLCGRHAGHAGLHVACMGARHALRVWPRKGMDAADIARAL